MSVDLRIMAVLVLAVVILGSRDDPRAWHWIRAQWRDTVGAYFKRRRERKAFGQPAPGWRNFRVR